MSELTVRNLVDLYLDGDPATGWHGARVEYAPKPGSRSSKADNMAYALRDLCNAVVPVPLDDPKATRRGLAAASRHVEELTPDQIMPSDLRAVQQHMIAINLCRNQINARKNRILRFFRWAAEYEYIDPAIVARLEVVRPIKKRHPGVRETRKVQAVADEVVAQTLACCRPVVARAIRLQRLTGMRPGELVRMRVCDIHAQRVLDAAGDDHVLWLYRPALHKTESHGVTRNIRLGPEAQAVLREQVSATTGQGELADGELRTPRLGDRADERRVFPWARESSYYQAVQRAAERAGVPSWSPNQLRHRVGTHAVHERGEDVGAEILGHTDPRTTRRNYVDPHHRGADQYALDFG
jgi:integrase